MGKEAKAWSKFTDTCADAIISNVKYKLWREDIGCGLPPCQRAMIINSQGVAGYKFFTCKITDINLQLTSSQCSSVENTVPYIDAECRQRCEYYYR